MNSEVIDTVRAFIDAINRADLSAMGGLMAEDHTFVDSGGRTETGRKAMLDGWAEYFRMFPDYRIDVQEMVCEGGRAAVFGSAFGTYHGKRGLVAENRIEMPAAWRARVENGKVRYWQVYADWSEGWKIIEADEADPSGRSASHE